MSYIKIFPGTALKMSNSGEPLCYLRVVWAEQVCMEALELLRQELCCYRLWALVFF